MLSDIMLAYSVEQTEMMLPRVRMRLSVMAFQYCLRNGMYTQLNGRSICISRSMG